MGKGLKSTVTLAGGICLCTLIISVSGGIGSDSYAKKSAEADNSFKNGSTMEKPVVLGKEQKSVNMPDTDIWGAEYITEIDFGNQVYVTQEDIINIGQLQHLKSLRIRIGDDMIDLSPLGNLAELEELSIHI